MVMPGWLASLAGETSISRQHQAQPDQEHAQRCPGQPQTQPEQGDQRYDSNRTGHQSANPDRLAIQSDQRRLVEIGQNQQRCPPDAQRQQRAGAGVFRWKHEMNERICQHRAADCHRHQSRHQHLDQRIECFAPRTRFLAPHPRERRKCRLLEDQAERQQSRDHTVRRSVKPHVSPRAQEPDDQQIGRDDHRLRELNQADRAAALDHDREKSQAEPWPRQAVILQVAQPNEPDPDRLAGGQPDRHPGDPARVAHAEKHSERINSRSDAKRQSHHPHALGAAKDEIEADGGREQHRAVQQERPQV